MSRRIVAVVLPTLPLELTRGEEPGQQGSGGGPLAVVLREPTAEPASPTTTRLFAVNASARRLGVRPGQTVAEAGAFAAGLVVRELAPSRLRARLGELAEIALGLGPVASVEAPDTVWLDVTGAAHLAGGEEALGLALAARLRALGHAVRIAIASGPRGSQALARHGPAGANGVRIVPPGGEPQALAELPLAALPLAAEARAFFASLGVLTVGALGALPGAALTARLGAGAERLLSLLRGEDPEPLVPHVPPAYPSEQARWEEPAAGLEPLLFVLRGLAARLGARLEGRGEALLSIEVVVEHDRAVARHAGVPAETRLVLELGAPVHRPAELVRVVSARLARLALPAPSMGLVLTGRIVTRALALQLPLARQVVGPGAQATRGPETLPVVLAELVAELGKERVGVLGLQGSHRPERKSRLVPVTRELLRDPPVVSPPAPLREAPARLLPVPAPFPAALRPGVLVGLGGRLYSVERVAFDHRVDGAEWWTGSPVSRDYVRIWLRSGASLLEGLVRVDRATRRRELEGLFD